MIMAVIMRVPHACLLCPAARSGRIGSLLVVSRLDLTGFDAQ